MLWALYLRLTSVQAKERTTCNKGRGRQSNRKNMGGPGPRMVGWAMDQKQCWNSAEGPDNVSPAMSQLQILQSKKLMFLLTKYSTLIFWTPLMSSVNVNKARWIIFIREMVKFLLLPLLEVLNAFFLYKNLKFKISWLLKKFNSMGVLVHQSKVKYILGCNKITFYAFW